MPISSRSRPICPQPPRADLPAVAASTAPPVASRRRWLIGVFAPVTRSGRRAFGERNVVLSIFAPARLDLRQAEISGGEATITVFSLFAPVFVTLPEHIDVESSIVALLAPVQERAPEDVPPNAPRVRIRGVSFCGPVFVQSSRS